MMTLAHTQVLVQIVITDDTGNLTTFLLALTSLIGVIIKFSQFVTATAQFVSIVIEGFNDTIQPVIVALKLLSIGLNSLAFGLGARPC